MLDDEIKDSTKKHIKVNHYFRLEIRRNDAKLYRIIKNAVNFTAAKGTKTGITISLWLYNDCRFCFYPFVL